MRKLALIAVVAGCLLALLAPPSDAWYRWSGRGGVVIGIGPYWGGYPFWGGYPYWGPYRYWGYAPPYYAYPPPVVVEEEPRTYVEPPPSAPAPRAYWYYCQSARAYYPEAPSCPEPWVRVPARAE